MRYGSKTGVYTRSIAGRRQPERSGDAGVTQLRKFAAAASGRINRFEKLHVRNDARQPDNLCKRLQQGHLANIGCCRLKIVLLVSVANRHWYDARLLIHSGL